MMEFLVKRFVGDNFQGKDMNNYLKNVRLFSIVFITSLWTSNSFAQDVVTVIFKMKMKGIEFVKLFDAKTDPNHQLGRPNQYIEKVSWPDPEVDHKFESDGYYDDDIPAENFIGGTIEKFKNRIDLDRRYNYIKNVHLSMPTTNQYMYKKGLFLLRLDKEFTPDQAKKYESQFYKVVR